MRCGAGGAALSHFGGFAAAFIVVVVVESCSCASTADGGGCLVALCVSSGVTRGIILPFAPPAARDARTLEAAVRLIPHIESRLQQRVAQLREAVGAAPSDDAGDAVAAIAAQRSVGVSAARSAESVRVEDAWAAYGSEMQRFADALLRAREERLGRQTEADEALLAFTMVRSLTTAFAADV